MRYTKTERPGVYHVVGTDLTSATLERDELGFVVNLDPRGSDLTMAPASALPASGTSNNGDAGEQTRRIELWHALAAALLLLLLVEGLLVSRN